jgi:RNA polymerase sigma-70 factor (ECF subfamily)
MRMERQLVERAQDGDHEAFDQIVGPRFDRLYAIARRIVRDPDVADDAVQDCIVRGWRDIRGLKDPDRLEAWLYRLLVRACYDQLRHERRRIEMRVLPIDRADETDANQGVADRDSVERGFRHLSPEHRAVLVLHHYLGLQAAEIADTLGVATGTIYSRLHYATDAMRAAIEADTRLVVRGAGEQPA